jgi:hypothetical protein
VLVAFQEFPHKEYIKLVIINESSFVLELSRQLNLMKSSEAISHVRCLYATDISRTISAIIIIISSSSSSSLTFVYLKSIKQFRNFRQFTVTFIFWLMEAQTLLLLVYDFSGDSDFKARLHGHSQGPLELHNK